MHVCSCFRTLGRTFWRHNEIRQSVQQFIQCDFSKSVEHPRRFWSNFPVDMSAKPSLSTSSSSLQQVTFKSSTSAFSVPVSWHYLEVVTDWSPSTSGATNVEFKSSCSHLRPTTINNNATADSLVQRINPTGGAYRMAGVPPNHTYAILDQLTLWSSSIYRCFFPLADFVISRYSNL